MRKIFVSFFILGLLAYGSTAIALTPYEQCLTACSLNAPSISQCMILDPSFGDMNTDMKQLRKECKDYRNAQRLNCKMDCYVDHNMPKDPKRERAIEFWDRAVKNFPNEKED